MPILNGVKAEADQIDAAKHHFVGTWRPPVPPTLAEIEDLPHNQGRVGTDCRCGLGIYTDTQAYLGQIRRHWLGGCFDEAQYVSLPPKENHGTDL